MSRISLDENERDRDLVARAVINKDLTPALDGIEEWSHIYVIFWLDRVTRPPDYVPAEMAVYGVSRPPPMTYDVQ